MRNNANLGRFILAHYEDTSIIVYQAYRPEIGNCAIKHGRFGCLFSYNRMSWIKPNFLWMMYRSGWGVQPGQEITLALRLSRKFFDQILDQAVQPSFVEGHHKDREAWKTALNQSSVRLQWDDPDHDPRGNKLDRRAIQLGLRGPVLQAYGAEELLEVIDMSDFVTSQREAANLPDFAGLETPAERVYYPKDKAVCARLGLQNCNIQLTPVVD